jgi:hypothetical protein
MRSRLANDRLRQLWLPIEVYLLLKHSPTLEVSTDLDLDVPLLLRRLHLITRIVRLFYG